MSASRRIAFPWLFVVIFSISVSSGSYLPRGASSRRSLERERFGVSISVPPSDGGPAARAHYKLRQR